MLFDEEFPRLVTVAVLLVAVVGVWAYVELRGDAASRRGGDVRAARRSALAEALPVAGAGLVGVFAFMAAIAVIGVVLVMSVFSGWVFRDPEQVGSLIGWVLVTGTTVLLGLPFLAVAVVVGVKHLRRR